MAAVALFSAETSRIAGKKITILLQMMRQQLIANALCRGSRVDSLVSSERRMVDST